MILIGSAVAAIAASLALARHGSEPFATWLYLFCWYPTLVILAALVARREGRNPLGVLTLHTLSLFAWSAVFWFLFELLNWRLANWYYVYVPAQRMARWIGITFAFATVLPAVFLAARAISAWPALQRLSMAPVRVTPSGLRASLAAGVLFLALPMAWPARFFPLVWGAGTLLAEPLLYRRAPQWSLFADLDRGDPRRIVRLLLGGAAVGMLWEFYNSFARGRWIYTVPGLEELKLFEMPLLGFLGFPIFALECWSWFHLLASLGVATAEDPLRGPVMLGRKIVTASLGAAFAAGVLLGMERFTISSYSPRLADVPGLPRQAAERLESSGEDPFRLAGLAPAELARRAGSDSSDAARWRGALALVSLRGIGTENARLLIEARIFNVDQLALHDPDSLAARLRRGPRPSPGEVRVWVRAAREALAAPGRSQDFDVVFLGGTVVDGTGAAARRADVGVRGDRIAAIGELSGRTAARIVDARGLVVAPGFIDMLGHSEMTLLVDPRGLSKITQGITTEVTGEGVSAAPISRLTMRNDSAQFAAWGLEVDWRDFDGYFRRLERTGIPFNLGSFVGATQVRKYVIGYQRRSPTAEELERMVALVDTAMRQGALGLSTSLVYAPAVYAGTGELIALARAAGRHGGIYITHLRNEGTRIREALREAFTIGRRAGLPVEVWHLKLANRGMWGRMGEILAIFDSARSAGARVGANAYPYSASATSLSAAIPAWGHEGGDAALVARLRDPTERERIRRRMIREGRGVSGIMVLGVLDSSLRRYEGRFIADIAREEGKTPYEALFDLLVADNAKSGAAFFTMSEDDVRRAIAASWVGVVTDHGATAPDGPLGMRKVHPRAWGTFPRILGRHVREERLLSLETAIRKMTGVPAERLGLTGRGLVREGYFADLVVFDPATVTDRATFQEPHQPAVGIRYVMVNGRFSLYDGQPTGARAGRVLRGPAWSGP